MNADFTTHRLRCGWLLLALVGACASGASSARKTPPSGVSLASLGRIPTEPLAAYRQAGFLVAGEPFPLVGTVHALAGTSPESTIVLVTFSLPNRVLTFTRDGEQYHASYSVAIEWQRDSLTVRRYRSRELVRVETFRETSRGEESIIFQQYFTVAPGEYTLSLRAADSAAGRFASTQATVTVPRYDPDATPPPIPVYRVEPRPARSALPAMIPNPRSTAVFGRDTVFLLYVESSVAQDSAFIPIRVVDQRKRTIFTDTLLLRRHGELLSGTAVLPVAHLALGVITAEAQSPRGAVTSVPLVVSLGDGLAVATFDEMVEYLRYYVTGDRLHALRDTTPNARPASWAKFLRDTDPTPTTIEHEGLRDYFHRLAEANARFRDEGIPGWLTERGMVYATLGEPDRIYEGQGPRSLERGRAQIWEYVRHRIQLIFVDVSGFGRWQLSPGSEAEFASAANRVRAH